VKSRLLLLLLFLGLGAIAIGWVFESNIRIPQEKTSLLIPDDIDFFLTNMKYRELDDRGLLKYEFQSPRLEHYPLNDISSIEQPSMQIHGDDPWLVDSLNGEIQHRIDLLHLTRQVVMQKQGPSPMQVYGESIRFEPNRDLITADSDILIVNPLGRINAERAVFDLARKVYRFTRARAVYQNEDS